VDAWIGNFPALKELDEEYEWFRPMIVTIGYRLLEEVPWGVKARVTVGAVTSMADLLTDIYVTYMFWSDGMGGYFKASLASLAVSIGIQLLWVNLQYRRLGKQRVLKECVPVLMGFKPAVDALRVAKGEKQEAGCTLEPMMEMTMMKSTEVFAEAIPGVIIQLTAIATTGGDKQISSAALLSLAISALTTGFSGATISYDFDTDPQRRNQTPDFYGYVPSSTTSRLIVFVALVFFSAGVLIIRCTVIVLLGQQGTSLAFGYIGADIALYLLIKLLRHDFWYWMPVGGNAEILSSFIARVLIKIITDFTSIVQFRHPTEIGGLTWTLSFGLTIATLPVAIEFARSNGAPLYMIDFSNKIATFFIPSTLLFLGVFFFNIKKEYLKTFFSTSSGKEITTQGFLNAKEDATRAHYALKRSHHHVSIIKEDVRTWIETNWEKWEEEKPHWLDEAMKSRIPAEFIPTTGEARRRESERRASHNAVKIKGLGGALRASIRRASQGTTLGGDAKVVPTKEEDN
jgi:hypothetical protein